MLQDYKAQWQYKNGFVVRLQHYNYYNYFNESFHNLVLKYFNITMLQELQELQDETCVRIWETKSSITVLQQLQTHWYVS